MSQHKLPVITDCASLRGTYVLVRTSLNVPVFEGVVQNQFRIMRSLITLQYLVKQGARVIVCAHIGRETHETLKPVYDLLQTSLPITFSSQVVGEETTQKRNALQDGEVLLIENLRSDSREKSNDAALGKDLADLAEIYVNDAFPVSHRSHASLVRVPEFLPSYFGINFVHEYEELQKARNPQSPSLFILGGAKFDTKMQLIEKYIEIYDSVFIGGALANDFFKAQGLQVGTSLVSDVSLADSPLLKHTKILLPIDVVVVNAQKVSRTTTPEDVHEDESIVDAGPETVKMLAPYIVDAQTILWNGPLGDYESGFGAQTESCARAIADAAGYSVIGGGDTVAAIEALNCQEKYNFLSTAGGAMLEFLQQGTLPAIDAVLKQAKD